MPTQMNVAVLIADWVELVDMNGPVDVFLQANSNSQNYTYNVYTVAANSNPILAEGYAVKIEPTYNINNCPEPGIIVIPGLIDIAGNTHFMSDDVIDWIKKYGNSGKIVMSVCIGAFTLAKTGLLDGKMATTHFMSFGDFAETFGGQGRNITLMPNVRYQVNEPGGKIISTGGITSGIDGALYVLSTLESPAVAKSVAKVLVYDMDAPIPPDTRIPDNPVIV